MHGRVATPRPSRYDGQEFSRGRKVKPSPTRTRAPARILHFLLNFWSALAAGCPLSPSHTKTPGAFFFFLHPPPAASNKTSAAHMMNVVAPECKRRHLKSESPPVLTSERIMTEPFNHLNSFKSCCWET